MSWFQAVIMGLVQGIAEFLPISSTAHLALLPWVFNWKNPELHALSFDVALHVGTLVAIVAYFWRDWVRLIARGFTHPLQGDGRLFWFLVIALIPGALAGFLLQTQAETIFRAPWLIGLMLIVMGVILGFSDRMGSKRIDLEHISFWRAIAVGVGQAFAIIPGVSRSGSTMTAGLLVGMTREAAARFSFLLSAPIILGAALVEVPHAAASGSLLTTHTLLAIVVAAISGFAAIAFLLDYLKRHGFGVFVWYRIVVGLFVIGLFLVRG
ncbi:MAG: undecaprenyl-diphosphate phosphatase [Firmicutes bacterium]|nr:undecaprenyl-diphosphate phosphatase [Bacillota bacterium]